MILSTCIRTDRYGQTEQTQIKLLLKEQSDQDRPSLPLHLNLLDTIFKFLDNYKKNFMCPIFILRYLWYSRPNTQHMSQLMRLWYLSQRRPVKAQASLCIRAVSPQPSLFAHLKYGSRQRVRPKIRHLAPLDGWACGFEEWVYGGRKVP